MNAQEQLQFLGQVQNTVNELRSALALLEASYPAGFIHVDRLRYELDRIAAKLTGLQTPLLAEHKGGAA